MSNPKNPSRDSNADYACQKDSGNAFSWVALICASSNNLEHETGLVVRSSGHLFDFNLLGVDVASGDSGSLMFDFLPLFEDLDISPKITIDILPPFSDTMYRLLGQQLMGCIRPQSILVKS